MNNFLHVMMCSDCDLVLACFSTSCLFFESQLIKVCGFILTFRMVLRAVYVVLSHCAWFGHMEEQFKVFLGSNPKLKRCFCFL